VLTVCHLTRSRSERVVWLMEELGLEYALEVYPREETGAAPASMKETHPIGRAPMIRDGDTVLAESGAIVEYIIQRHGKGRLALAPGHADYPRYLYWLHFAEGSLMSLMLIALAISRIPEAKDSPVKARTAARLKAMLDFVDGEIGGRDYFTGSDFTAADIMMAFPFTTMRRFLDYDIAPYANIAAWMKRIEARPAHAKAMAIAGPDAPVTAA
jgi:glutathione S-transferase